MRRFSQDAEDTSIQWIPGTAWPLHGVDVFVPPIIVSESTALPSAALPNAELPSAELPNAGDVETNEILVENPPSAGEGDLPHAERRPWMTDTA